MTSRGRYWFPWALLLAGAALAQPADKPAFRVIDPERPRTDRRTVQVVTIDYPSADPRTDRFPKALPNLLAYLRTISKLDLTCQAETRSLADSIPAPTRAILLYMTGSDAVLRLSAAEKTNLSRLLQLGALLYAEEIRRSDPRSGLEGKDAGVAGTSFDRQFKELMRDPLVLGARGERWEKIPRTHPLYSCYFGFPDGPPLGGASGGNVRDLEMLQLGGRVAVIFSDLNISWYWGDPLVEDQVRERGLQFGVNLLIFAKTQGAGR